MSPNGFIASTNEAIPLASILSSFVTRINGPLAHGFKFIYKFAIASIMQYKIVNK